MKSIATFLWGAGTVFLIMMTPNIPWKAFAIINGCVVAGAFISFCSNHWEKL